MGSGLIGTSGANGSPPASPETGCRCDANLKCWCRWRWEQQQHRYVSSGFVFFFGCLLLFGSIATAYAWLAFSPFPLTPPPFSSGCEVDGEGSWSIGVFYGDSPFSLKPIEAMNVRREGSAAWPVANPVVTCASASDAGFPSNFVADPFLYIQDDILYLFYETKNSITMQGDIGVAKSSDNGATWQHMGIALDEDWHLSYPYVFNYLNQIYMVPESSEKGEVRLYRAINFPLQWKLEKIILKKPLIDSFIINHDDMYWLFGSDHTGFGSKKNGHLEIWYSSTPLGPWIPHKKNPIYNGDRSIGARNGGRPFVYNGVLYRIGQDCGQTYGRRSRAFKVESLTKDEYKETEVPLNLEEPKKGRNAWNGARSHHLDVQQLSSGMYIGVIDGDRVPSGDSTYRFMLGCASAAVVAALIILLGLLLGTVKCIVPLNWCARSSGKRTERPNLLSSKMRQLCSRMNKVPSLLHGRVKCNSCWGRLILAIVFISGVVVSCRGVKYIYGGNGAEEAYLWKGHYSQFTLLTMTYDARLWNLKMFVKHYSRCSSVKEIVVVWNKGVPPKPNDFDSAVPVRIRVEKKNSLNNRFKVDPLIKTRGVLELDDDIMMPCGDIERGFKVWREHPDRIVGFYPRLIEGRPLKYRGEKYARARKGYNVILTGAAFMDSEAAFERYWSEQGMAGREVVDNYFNCEDVLMNFLYANASRSTTVAYVKPTWAIDTSKLSGAAISRDTNVHYQKRSYCLATFTKMYGSLCKRKERFDGRKDGWDV